MVLGVLALVVGVLYATGMYMILRRSLVKVIIGLNLLSHGANLLIFTAGGLTRDKPALVPPHGTLDPEHVADPLPQALVLTAIVISFGLLAFALALFHTAFQSVGTDDLDDMKATDR